MNATAPTNSKATISIVSGVIALLLGIIASCVVFFVFPPLVYCTGFILLAASLVATVTGFMARQEIRQSGGTQDGESMALIGLVLGLIGLGVVLLLCLVMILSVAGLLLLGPQIGTVFSEIERNLQLTPTPIAP